MIRMTLAQSDMFSDSIDTSTGESIKDVRLGQQKTTFTKNSSYTYFHWYNCINARESFVSSHEPYRLGPVLAQWYEDKNKPQKAF